MLTLVLSAIIYAMRSPSERSPLLYWVLAFYWALLAALAALLATAIRRAAPEVPRK